MRKIFIALLAGLSILGLAGCGETGSTKTPPKKKTVIQYAGWDLGSDAEPTLKRKMIEEFNSTSEDIIIEMVPSTDPVQTFLNTLASNGSLPDVFLIDSVPAAVINEWALNITPYVNQDPEWKDCEVGLKEAITYEGTDKSLPGQVFALPAAQHYVGFLANYELLELYYPGEEDVRELFAPGGFTTEQFFNVIPKIRSKNTNGSSVVGINAVGDMINWLPSVMADSTDHFVWDGEQFDYTGEAIVNALKKINALGKIEEKNTFNSYADATAEEDPRISLFGSADAAQVFLRGQIGFYQGMTSDDVSSIDFDYKFIGYPDNRVVSAGDFLCISAATKNPEAAYEVAKFLSYGADGIQARYKIVKENPKIQLTGLPVNTNPAVTSEWFDYVEMEGVKEIYDSVIAGETKVIVEGLKTIPGFVKARYTAETGIKFDTVRGGAPLSIGDLIWDVCEGEIQPNQYQTTMTEAKAKDLNSEVSSAMAKIKAVVDKTRK